MSDLNSLSSEELILHIVRLATADGRTVNKTKLLKFVYMMDVAYYRKHRQILSGYTWIFYKYGPWTSSFDNDYWNLRKNQKLFVTETKEDGYSEDIIRFRRDLEGIEKMPPSEISLLFKRTCAKWLDKDLSTLLNHIYFETEPMIGAKKGEELDFEKIDTDEQEPTYYRKKTNISGSKLKKRRAEFLGKIKKDKQDKLFFDVEGFDSQYWEDVANTD
ncbi:MAG: hypothetical protein JXI43_10685 [Tissierellales bacterium]|nr:hypothetical protein [Tissierellales bacterium]